MTMTLEQFNTLQKGTTTFCLIGKIEAAASRGGDILRFARHSSSIVFGGEFYPSIPVVVSEFQAVAGTEIDNATFQSVLDDTFSRLNIKGGKWQGATATLMIVDYTNLSAGYILRQRGRWGQAKILGREAEIEYRGLTSLLSQEIGEKTSRLCRDKLGGHYCTLDLTAFTFAGAVTDVDNNQKFSISVSKPNGYFYRGKITFTSGDNEGLSMETQNNTGTLLTLFQPMLRDIAVGDSFEIIAGDDKKLETCHNKFNNAVNFFGEPDIPQREQLFKFPA